MVSLRMWRGGSKLPLIIPSGHKLKTGKIFLWKKTLLDVSPLTWDIPQGQDRATTKCSQNWGKREEREEVKKVK